MPKIIRNGITYKGLPDIDYDCEISNVTLYAANWSSGVYTISDPRIDTTTVQKYIPGLGITDTQLEALQAANICDFGQDAGHAYLKAYGDTPSIDIPIRVIFNPGVKTKEVDSNNAYVLWLTITDKTYHSLPNDWEELYIAVQMTPNNYYFVTTTILKTSLPNEESWIVAGAYGSNDGSFYIDKANNRIKLYATHYNGNETSGSISVYYR